jgi:hypothetical protein
MKKPNRGEKSEAVATIPSTSATPRNAITAPTPAFDVGIGQADQNERGQRDSENKIRLAAGKRSPEEGQPRGIANEGLKDGERDEKQHGFQTGPAKAQGLTTCCDAQHGEPGHDDRHQVPRCRGSGEKVQVAGQPERGRDEDPDVAAQEQAEDQEADATDRQHRLDLVLGRGDTEEDGDRYPDDQGHDGV